MRLASTGALEKVGGEVTMLNQNRVRMKLELELLKRGQVSYKEPERERDLLGRQAASERAFAFRGQLPHDMRPKLQQ